MVFLIWTVAAIPGVVQSYINANDAGEHGSLASLLLMSFSLYWTDAILSFPMYWLSGKFPLDRRPYWKSFLVHLVAFPLVVIAFGALRALMFAIIPPDRQYDYSFAAIMKRMFHNGLIGGAWAYFLMVSGAHAFRYYQSWRQRELQAAELRAQVARYELQIVKLQLHPHFLFNCLNGISALMSTDVSRARAMMTRLSDMLRSSLRFDTDTEISLREELEFVESYVSLQEMRLGPKLTFTQHVDPATLDARIPNMLLQPLVENAIRHGVEPSKRPGPVELRVTRQNGTLSVSLFNDGASEASTQLSKGSGVGLANVGARLRSLYGDNQRIALTRVGGDRVEVNVQLPFRTGPEGDA